MSDPPVSFNLWHEPWIRVMGRDGGDAELSIGACLAEAHALAALSDPSPLVVGGTHRLLAAILQAIYAPRDLGQIAALLGAGRFDAARLEQFAAQHAARFDLFHPTAPFLQTGDVPLDGWKRPGKDASKDVKDGWVEPSAVAALFADIPSATNRTLFYHTSDELHRACPTCCARGLVSIPPFARAEGGGPEGYRPAITGGPPIYVLPTGSSMFQSLALSLVVPDYAPRKASPLRSGVAVWNMEPLVPRKQEVSAIGYIESLCFPVRRVRLFPHSQTTLCTICGSATNIVVHEAYLKMGMSLNKSLGVWDDPFVAYQLPKKRADKEPFPVQPQAGKELWREYSGLLLAERGTKLRPRVVQQVSKLVERGALNEEHNLRFRCVGLRVDQAKVEAWLDEALEAPPALLTDDDAAGYVDSAIERAEELRFILESSFDGHFRPARDRGGRNEKLARFKAVRSRMTADYWRRLAPEFRRFIAELETVEGREATERAWIETLVREGRCSFDAAAEQIGERADALRARVEAQASCYRRLAGKRKEWIDGQ
jgi:CRISPR system Cascade subunit CasA